MTQKDKELLLKDLCGRLPYGVLLQCAGNIGEKLVNIDKKGLINHDWDIDEVRPYLRPLSSMTEEEVETYRNLQSDVWKPCGTMYYDNIRSIDWLNEHHFDYRRLIEKGLAIEAPEGMYKTEEQQ